MNYVVFWVAAFCYVAVVLVCYLLNITHASSKLECSPCVASDSRALVPRKTNTPERNISPVLFPVGLALRSAAILKKNVPSVSFLKGRALESAKTLEKKCDIVSKAVSDKENEFFASFTAMLEDTELKLQRDFEQALKMIDDLGSYFDNVLLERVNNLEAKVKRL